MLLADVARDRDNNFNLIRLIAAFAVLVSHSFVIATGPASIEPGRNLLGLSLGGIAVHVFFFTSGFLVTGSMLKRRSVSAFICARALRVLPGLWVMLLLCGVILGPLFTTLHLADYFASPTLRDFLLRGGTLVAGVVLGLPGVFGVNPYTAVNGSLWTLPYEVYCYILLLAIWVGSRRIKLQGFTAPPQVLGLIALSFLTLVFSREVAPDGQGWRRLMLFHMFFVGAAAYMLRQHLTLTWHRLFALLTVLLIALAAGKAPFFLAYVLCLPLLVLHLAYLPGGALRKFNRIGDYSYGIYIYAFPLQQIVAALIPSVSAMEVMVYSGALVLFFAYVSWHAIEKPALEQYDRLIGLSRGRLVHRVG